MIENVKTAEPRSYKERFEFELTVGNNIICQRYFRIANFNPKSLQSYELTDAIRKSVSIINTDLFEEYNSRMKELMVCYGNKFVVDDDALCAKRYLSVLDDELVRTELRNKMRLKFLEDCEIYDEVQ